MYEVTTANGDYQLGIFKTYEEALAFANRCVNEGHYVACAIYQGRQQLETVSLF